MTDPDYIFWLGEDAEAARAEVLAEMGGCMIENQHFTAVFLPDDTPDPSQDELG